MSVEDDDRNVGYRKPPRRTQFKKGVSGNRRGRPKGTGNVSSIMDEILAQPTRLKISGRQVVVTGRQALAMKLVDRAMTGDVRMIQLLQRYGYLSQADGPMILWLSEMDRNL